MIQSIEIAVFTMLCLRSHQLFLVNLCVRIEAGREGSVNRFGTLLILQLVNTLAKFAKTTKYDISSHDETGNNYLTIDRSNSLRSISSKCINRYLFSDILYLICRMIKRIAIISSNLILFAIVAIFMIEISHFML